MCDLGVAEEDAFEDMMDIWNPRCPPGFRLELLRQKVRNAYHYRKNEPGCADPRKEFTAILPPGIRQLPENFDPRNIPVRDWMLGRRLLRRTVSELVGAPGTVKSMLCLCSAIAIVTRREITGEQVRVPGPTLVYDAEDPVDEFDRRIAGICYQHGIDHADVRRGLFYQSGHERPLVIARKEGEGAILPNEPEVTELIRFVRSQGIVAVFLTPLVALHRGAKENSNDDMEAVMSVARRIAADGNCAVSLSQHTPKSSAKERDGGAGDMNIGRGAGATIGAARRGHTLTWIPPRLAQELAVPANLVNLMGSKGNYSARDTTGLWFEVRSVEVGNGTGRADEFRHPDAAPGDPSDTVGVPVVFDMMAAERTAAGEKLAKQDSLVSVIAAAMPSDRCSVGAVVSVVMAARGCKDRKAKELIANAVPMTETGIRAMVDGQACILRRARKGEHSTAPVEISRVWEDR
jgi:AAA domain